MKKIIFTILPLFLIFTAVSCNERLEGDEVQSVNSLKIDSVIILNDTMAVFSKQSIKTFSNFTSNCEGFYGYDYLHTDEFERKVISYKFKTDANCGEMVVKGSRINFQPQKRGTYNFKFYTGKNTAGENTYLEKSIFVQ